MNTVRYVDQIARLTTGGICCRLGGTLSAEERYGFQFVYRAAASIYWNDELSRFEDRYQQAGEAVEDSCRRLLNSVKNELGYELRLSENIDWTDLTRGTQNAVAEVFRKF